MYWWGFCLLLNNVPVQINILKWIFISFQSTEWRKMYWKIKETHHTKETPWPGGVEIERHNLTLPALCDKMKMSLGLVPLVTSCYIFEVGCKQLFLVWIKTTVFLKYIYLYLIDTVTKISGCLRHNLISIMCCNDFK